MWARRYGQHDSEEPSHANGKVVAAAAGTSGTRILRRCADSVPQAARRTCRSTARVADIMAVLAFVVGRGALILLLSLFTVLAD